MIKRHQVFIKQLVLLIDGLAILAAFLATYFFRQRFHNFYHLNLIPGEKVMGALRSIDNYLWLLFIIFPIWFAMLHLVGAYRELRVKSFFKISWDLLKASFLSLLLFGSFVFLLKLQYVSRTFIALFFIFSYSFLALERAFLIESWRVMSRLEYFHRKLLIVGTGPRARKFIKAVREHRNWGLSLMGLLDLDLKLVGKNVEGLEVIGVLDELPRILEERVVDEVIFVVPRNWMSRIEKAVLHCERIGVRTTLAADLFNLDFAKAHPSDLNGMPVISFDPTPVDQWQLAIKRTFDFLVAGTGLVLLAPLFLLTAAGIKLNSQGPVFFKQMRCGLNGRRFTLYKFRSMVADAEMKKAALEHLNEMNGPVFKAARDPRLTRVGKWIRKMSVDELPQLYNVLRGEMSLVGPRPPLPSEVEKYESWQRRRLSMRPGITGNWQVNGRNKIKDFDTWMRLDLDYIDQWSLVTDMKILLRTIPTVLFGIGAK